MNLLLLSNSTLPGESFMGWSAPVIRSFIGPEVKQIVFIPFAGVTISFDEYTAAVQNVFREDAISIKGIHSIDNKKEAIDTCDAIFVGGGNTFQLYNLMHEFDLLETIREKVKTGTPYIGWSAGSNMACPTLKTTNDMPIVSPKSFEGLNLVSFQINAHYTEKTIQGHGGESRMQRLKEFLIANPEVCVAGIPEGTYIEQNQSDIWFKGKEEMTWLEFNKEVKMISSQTKLNHLLSV